jgi:hypothetical protein
MFKGQQQSVGKHEEKLEPTCIAGLNGNDATTVERGLAAPQKVKQNLHVTFTPRVYIQKQLKICMHTKT